MPEGDTIAIDAKDRALHDTAREAVHSSPVAAIVALAEERGISLSAIQALTRLPLTRLLDPDRRLDDQVVALLFRMFAAVAPGTVVGKAAVNAVPMSFFGPLRDAIRVAPDLQSAVDLMVRFHPVLSSTLTLWAEDDRDGLAVWMSHPLDALDGGYGAELAIAVSCRMLRDELGMPDAVHSVHFVHAPLGPQAVYEQALGAPVHFSAAHNGVKLHPQALRRPTPHGDRTQFLAIQQGLATRFSQEPEFVRRLQAAIAENARNGAFSTSAVATRIGVGVRTLQRRARAHDVDLRGMLDEAREATARVLLQDPDLSMEQVAERAGYSTESAFRRAFKRWTGGSPVAVRAAEKTEG